MNCKVYVACKMTGRDRKEMLERAAYVSDVLKAWDLTPISPVLEEKVEGIPGPLLQMSQELLQAYWKRDKYIISDVANVVLIDEGERKSLGVEREYGFARYCLWKPTVTILPANQGFNIAQFEDDYVVHTVDAAAAMIAQNWGTQEQRHKWRWDMLKRTFPKWLWRQYLAWK
jgi:hypothetical protein